MKKVLVTIIISLSLILTINELSAQPGPPSDHGGTGDAAPSGGGAPISGGIGFLVAMGAAYGVRKWYLAGKEEKDE